MKNRGHVGLNQSMKDRVRSLLVLQPISNLHLIGSYPNLPNLICLPCLPTTTTYVWILNLQNYFIFCLFHYKIFSIKHFHFIVFGCIPSGKMKKIKNKK